MKLHWILVIILIVGCVGQETEVSDLAKKTVTVTLHSGEELEIGGYNVQLNTLHDNVISATINGQEITLQEGKRSSIRGARVEASVSADQQGDFAQIKITEQ